MVRVKICGLTSSGDARTAVEAGADLLGFVFVPGTPRYVDPGDAGWIREIRGALKVGVFRGAALGEVESVRRRLGLDLVQLHGTEPVSWALRAGPGTLRAIRVEGVVAWDGLARLVAAGCLPLLDSGGGTGRRFDWTLLDGRPAGLLFGLAGGLHPENVAEAVRTARPFLVDVSSGVESEPGRKDPGKVRAFVAAARGAALDRLQ